MLNRLLVRHVYDFIILLSNFIVLKNYLLKYRFINPFFENDLSNVGKTTKINLDELSSAKLSLTLNLVDMTSKFTSLPWLKLLTHIQFLMFLEIYLYSIFVKKISDPWHRWFISYCHKKKVECNFFSASILLFCILDKYFMQFQNSKWVLLNILPPSPCICYWL